MADGDSPAPDFDDWLKWDLIESFAVHWALVPEGISASPNFILSWRERGEGDQISRIGEANKYRYLDRRIISGHELTIFGRKIIRCWGFERDGREHQQTAICVDGRWENLTATGRTFKLRPEFREDRTHYLARLWVDIFASDGALQKFFVLEAGQ